MTVYLDVVLLENLVMNYIILFATGYILKTKRKQLWLLTSACIGAIYAIVTYLELLEAFSNFFMKILLSIAMIYLAYHPKGPKQLIKQLILFYLISFVFGGCAFALLYFIKPQNILVKNGVLVGSYPIKVAILGALIGFMVCALAFKLVKGKLSKKDMLCPIRIYFQDKQTEVIAFVDTGNILKDPISRMPVIVVEKEKIMNLVPEKIVNQVEQMLGGDAIAEQGYEENIEYLTKFRVIPFSSIGKQNGMLLAFRPDKIEILQEENEIITNKVMIGIYDKPLSKKKEYTALIGLDILEGSKENEFIENVSR